MQEGMIEGWLGPGNLTDDEGMKTGQDIQTEMLGSGGPYLFCVMKWHQLCKNLECNFVIYVQCEKELGRLNRRSVCVGTILRLQSSRQRKLSLLVSLHIINICTETGVS